jgi:hypothetical protein
VSGSAPLAFWALAGLLVAALCTILMSRDPRRRAAAEVGIAGAVAGLLLLLEAPFAALMAGTCGVGGALMTHARTETHPTKLDRGAHGGTRTTVHRSRRRGLRFAGGVVALMLGFTWLSMMARQFLSGGVDLAEHPGFGDAAGSVERWLERGTLSVVMLLVAGLIAVGRRSIFERRSR